MNRSSVTYQDEMSFVFERGLQLGDVRMVHALEDLGFASQSVRYVPALTGVGRQTALVDDLASEREAVGGSSTPVTGRGGTFAQRLFEHIRLFNVSKRENLR